MSTRSERRARFLREHPVCCYCSGQRLACELDHNPPRSLFPEGGVPKDLRFPSCSPCNRVKKDAESRAALVANAFSLIDPPSANALKASVHRSLAFVERDDEFRAAILDHPTHSWDFARGGPPSAEGDPMSPIGAPHMLPESFGAALFELGRFFAQALYYRLLKRVLLPQQLVGVALFTNAATEPERQLLKDFGASLTWFVPEPADKRQLPLFGFGAAYSAERRGAFAWIGLAGTFDPKILTTDDAHIWHGDGVRVVLESSP